MAITTKYLYDTSYKYDPEEADHGGRDPLVSFVITKGEAVHRDQAQTKSCWVKGYYGKGQCIVLITYR